MRASGLESMSLQSNLEDLRVKSLSVLKEMSNEEITGILCPSTGKYRRREKGSNDGLTLQTAVAKPAVGAKGGRDESGQRKGGKKKDCWHKDEGADAAVVRKLKLTSLSSSDGRGWG